MRFEVVVTSENAGDRVKNLNVKNEDGNYGDIDDEAIYNVALPRWGEGQNTLMKRPQSLISVFSRAAFTGTTKPRGK